MGLGRLNPGCGCACSDPPPPPDDPCREAGYSLLPVSVSVSCPSYNLGQGLTALNSDPGPIWEANPGSATYLFPNYLDPNFACYVSAVSEAGPLSTDYNDAGYWKIFDNGECFFGFTNVVNWIPTQLGYRPVTFRCRLGIGRNLFTGSFQLNVELIADAIIVTGFRYTNSPPTSSCNWGVGDAGQVGNNWVRDAIWGLIETGAPSCRIFSFRRTKLIHGPLLGGFGLGGIGRETWVTSIWSMEMYSQYLINLDDPVWGDKRNFEMWVPDPAPFDFGIFDGVSGSVVLGTA